MHAIDDLLGVEAPRPFVHSELLDALREYASLDEDERRADELDESSKLLAIPNIPQQSRARTAVSRARARPVCA